MNHQHLNHGLAMALLAASLMLPAAAHAGRSCDAHPPTTRSVELSLALAEKTRASLNASGQQVVLLARAGQDLSKYGLRHSHLGLAWQVADGQGGTTWHVLHKLNGCGTPTDEASRTQAAPPRRTRQRQSRRGAACPAAGWRPMDLKNPDIDFYPHCGIGLFDHCQACSTRKSAFAKFCHACGANGEQPRPLPPTP